MRGATIDPISGLQGVAYTGTATVDYTGGNGGFVNGQSVSSTGVLGLTASLAGAGLLNGSGTLTFNLSGTPAGTGTASFPIDLGGVSCSFDLTIANLIEQQLSGSSLTNFIAASDGDWVAITRAEYNALAANLSDVTRFGVSEANALSGTNLEIGGGFGGTITYGQSLNPSPVNSYIFAFKVALNGGIIEGGNELVRLSAATDGTGYNVVGSTLPNGTIDNSQQHFVLKGADNLYANPMYLGFTMDETDHNAYWSSGITGLLHKRFNKFATKCQWFGIEHARPFNHLKTMVSMKQIKSSLYLLTLIVFPFYASSQQAMQNEGNMQLHAGATMSLFGDFTNNGTFVNDAGTLCTEGSSSQTINGSSPITLNNFVLDNNADIQLENALQVAGTFTFTAGKVISDRANSATEYVHFLAGSSHTGADDNTYIDGAVRKTGNTAFTFPVGAEGNLQPISISAPALVTDHFTAYYTESIAPYDRSAKDAAIDHVSGCEYWILNQTGGTSSVEVSLTFDANSCGVDQLCELLVCRWDGASWVNHGNGGTTGTTSAGTVMSGNGTGSCGTPQAVINFSPFTLGSSSGNNSLPVELLGFDARDMRDGTVALAWQTAIEINSDHFIVERSPDRNIWEDILSVQAAGE